MINTEDLKKNMSNACDSIQDIAQAFDCEILAYVLPKGDVQPSIPMIICTLPNNQATELFGSKVCRLMDDMLTGKHKPCSVEETTYNVFMGAVINHIRHNPSVVVSILSALKEMSEHDDEEQFFTLSYQLPWGEIPAGALI